MCVRLNNNKLNYEKREVSQNNINKSEQVEKIDDSNKIETSKIKKPEPVKDISNTQKIAVANFSPKGINFGISIFSSELGNIKKNNTKQVNINQSNKPFKIPEKIEISAGIGYNLIKGGEKTLEGDVKSLTYKKFGGDKNTETTLRAEISDPKKTKVSVIFKEKKELVETILKSTNSVVFINGGFRAGANSDPQGNILGDNLVDNKTAIYKLQGNKSAAEGRAFLGITKDKKLEIGKGGKLDSTNINKYQYLMSGLGLLASNKENNFKTKEDFYNFIKKNNDAGTILNLFRINKDETPERGDQILLKLIADYKKSHPKEKMSREQIIDKVIKEYPINKLDEKLAPRSAIGVTKDNKLITLTIGHGDKRYGSFASVYECYKSLKDLGAVSMAMLDGGGATFKAINSKLEEKPEKISGYGYINAGICIGCK